MLRLEILLFIRFRFKNMSAHQNQRQSSDQQPSQFIMDLRGFGRHPKCMVYFSLNAHLNSHHFLHFLLFTSMLFFCHYHHNDSWFFIGPNLLWNFLLDEEERFSRLTIFKCRIQSHYNSHLFLDSSRCFSLFGNLFIR